MPPLSIFIPSDDTTLTLVEGVDKNGFVTYEYTGHGKKHPMSGTKTGQRLRLNKDGLARLLKSISFF